MPQLYRTREEPKHRDENWHLNQQRQTSPHRINPSPLVQRHRRLLLLQRIFLLRILRVYLVNFGLQHPHVRLVKVRLVSQRENYNLDKQRQQENNYTVILYK